MARHFKEFLFENILSKLESKLEKLNNLLSLAKDNNEKETIKRRIEIINNKILGFINTNK